jgi:hypothetical protein
VLKPAVGGGVAWIDRRASLLFLGAVKNEFDPRGETPTLSKNPEQAIVHDRLARRGQPIGRIVLSLALRRHGHLRGTGSLRNAKSIAVSVDLWCFFQWDYFSSPEFASISRRAPSPGIRLAKNQF